MVIEVVELAEELSAVNVVTFQNLQITVSDGVTVFVDSEVTTCWHKRGRLASEQLKTLIKGHLSAIDNFNLINVFWNLISDFLKINIFSFEKMTLFRH